MFEETFWLVHPCLEKIVRVSSRNGQPLERGQPEKTRRWMLDAIAGLISRNRKKEEPILGQGKREKGPFWAKSKCCDSKGRVRRVSQHCSTRHLHLTRARQETRESKASSRADLPGF
jgi:hypothetical protein